MTTDFEDSIEYLDEDEDIVKQCVESTSNEIINSKSLLRPVQKRKRKEEDDSEYDPSDDNMPTSPPSPPARKKRPLFKKVKASTSQLSKQSMKENKSFTHQKDHLNRKKYNIRIPDYDDPLCLPVRALKHDNLDFKRLNNWNKVCLEHLKHCNKMLKPERGVTKKSVRMAVFKNVVNNQTGTTETTVWSKNSVESETGEKKSEIFQSVLPRYKEKKTLGNYILGTYKYSTHRVTRDEVVLSKEEHKDGEVLVVYKPREALSAVYKLVDKSQSPEELPSSASESPRSMQEVSRVKMCAPCFHASWRGGRTGHHGPARAPVCPVCARSCVTVYNLLAHFKTHSNQEIRQYKGVIAKTLAQIVGYHYKCRICRKQFEGIKALRKHLPEHHGQQFRSCTRIFFRALEGDRASPTADLRAVRRAALCARAVGSTGKLTFKCEVGNHYVNRM